MSKVFQCNQCECRFDNYRALNGHKHSHFTGQRQPRSDKQFTTFKCLYCSAEHKAHTATSRYCNNTCRGLYEYETIKIPQILAGEVRKGDMLKRFLRNDRGDFCIECGQSNVHNGKPLTLQLDHIDGNSDNNFPVNLRLLCPNCHTQTTTFGFTGKRKPHKRNLQMQAYRLIQTPQTS